MKEKEKMKGISGAGGTNLHFLLFIAADVSRRPNCYIWAPQAMRTIQKNIVVKLNTS